MASPDPSSIQILYESTKGGSLIDITHVVLFESAHFDCQANALPGSFEFQIKDIDRSLSFVTGREVYLMLDGVKLFGGLILQISRVYAFPVVDTSSVENVSARQWKLTGMDFNVWFDKLVLRDPTDYKQKIFIDGLKQDGAIIREDLPNYLDVPPGVDMSSQVEDCFLLGTRPKSATGVTKKEGIVLVPQGHTWREQMDQFAARSAAIYYIDADKKLHYHALENVISPWNFADYKINGAIGVRNVSATQDAAPQVTDALVWGGLEQLAVGQTEGRNGVFFARYPIPVGDPVPFGGEDKNDEALQVQADYGRWQFAETHFEGADQGSTELRAELIIEGPPGTSKVGQVGGLRFPIWNITLTWFAHDVPGKQHIRPGHIATILLRVMGVIQTLPLRNMSVTFPQVPPPDGGPNALTFCQFQGQFGLLYSDTRMLWKFLMEQQRGNPKLSGGAASDSSSEAAFGAFGSFTPTSAAVDGEGVFISRANLGAAGSTPDGTTLYFAIPFAYVLGTTKVYLNGLLQRPNIEYAETDPINGVIRFYSPPVQGDALYMEARTGESMPQMGPR